jgi:flagellar biosynthesis anti-sigma factor FlgM
MAIDGIHGKSQAELVQFRVEKKELQENQHKASNPALVKTDEDQVQVSSRAQEFIRVRKLVDSLPDVRIDRVNQLSKAIESGTYNPKAEEIATALLDKHTIDELR